MTRTARREDLMIVHDTPPARRPVDCSAAPQAIEPSEADKHAWAKSARASIANAWTPSSRQQSSSGPSATIAWIIAALAVLSSITMAVRAPSTQHEITGPASRLELPAAQQTPVRPDFSSQQETSK